MRGTHSRCRRAANVTGIIPAYAGNTSGLFSGAIAGGDHPRVCGEHGRRQAILRNRSGSSPRMRGTRPPTGDSPKSVGIIPAYAGNTYPLAGIRSYTWDHPRVCGEHRWRPYRLYPTWGSSPRMRGTLAVRQWLAITQGIIPAYAGNTGMAPC